MTEEEIQKHVATISEMSHEQMAFLWRFAESGHVYFDKQFPLFDVFLNRFKRLGGMTSAVSKAIGWE